MTFLKGQRNYGGRPNLPDAKRRKPRVFCIPEDELAFIRDYGPHNPGRNLSVIVRVARALQDAARRQHDENLAVRQQAVIDAARVHELQGLPAPQLQDQAGETTAVAFEDKMR